MDSFIWPLASKLASDSVRSINNLLKIFSLWSERPYYYPLFAVRTTHFDQISLESQQLLASDSFKFKEFRERNVLDVVFELINVDKCGANVIDYVMDMVYNLVSYADFREEAQEEVKKELEEEEATSGFLSFVNTKPLPFDVEVIKSQLSAEVIEGGRFGSGEVNFGTCILKPHVGSIVDHIDRIVTENLAKKVLPNKPLKILARLSCFATNSSQQCEKIIQLLTSYLIKNRKQAEVRL